MGGLKFIHLHSQQHPSSTTTAKFFLFLNLPGRELIVLNKIVKFTGCLKRKPLQRHIFHLHPSAINGVKGKWQRSCFSPIHAMASLAQISRSCCLIYKCQAFRYLFWAHNEFPIRYTKNTH